MDTLRVMNLISRRIDEPVIKTSLSSEVTGYTMTYYLLRLVSEDKTNTVDCKSAPSGSVVQIHHKPLLLELLRLLIYIGLITL